MSEGQLHDALGNLSRHQPVAADEMHPKVLRELADVIAKALSRMSEKSGW